LLFFPLVHVEGAILAEESFTVDFLGVVLERVVAVNPLVEEVGLGERHFPVRVPVLVAPAPVLALVGVEQDAAGN
jgi:hypothetical protein